MPRKSTSMDPSSSVHLPHSDAATFFHHLIILLILHFGARNIYFPCLIFLFFIPRFCRSGIEPCQNASNHSIYYSSFMMGFSFQN